MAYGWKKNRMVRFELSQAYLMDKKSALGLLGYEYLFLKF